MAINIQKKIKKAENRSFLAKDFKSLKNELIQQAKIFFPDKIQDFSEPSIGGMLVDMAAYVGDMMSFYLDHQFKELDPMLATEPANIEMHLRNSGQIGHGATPSSVILTFYIDVPAETSSEGYLPKKSALPVLLKNTLAKSYTGTTFNITKDLDFAEVDSTGKYLAKYEVIESDTNGVPLLYRVARKVEAVSGLMRTQKFTVDDTHVPFREITLTSQDVSSIINITDDDGNTYYEVTSLSQDTVFTSVQNVNPKDSALVSNNLEVLPAPYRYVKKYSSISRRTTVRFGGGNADTLDDDIIPDPSNLSLSLYGKKTMSRFSMDPNSLLNTQTLGIAPRNTTLTVTYRHGGGLGTNVTEGSINEIIDLGIIFRNNPSAIDALSVRQSFSVNNKSSAGGGSNPPTTEDIRLMTINGRQKQSRIVTREDVLSRIYTLPTIYGKVYRAALEHNPINPLSTLLYMLSLDEKGNIAVSPDALKTNLSKYLNEYRLLGDAYDILDGQIINFGIAYAVVTTPNANKTQVIQQINSKLAVTFKRDNFQIGQPFIIDDITNIILNTPFVVGVNDLRVHPLSGLKAGRTYSDTSFSFENSTKNGIIFLPPGSIFELKYPTSDIAGSAV